MAESPNTPLNLGRHYRKERRATKSAIQEVEGMVTCIGGLQKTWVSPQKRPIYMNNGFLSITNSSFQLNCILFVKDHSLLLVYYLICTIPKQDRASSEILVLNTDSLTSNVHPPENSLLLPATRQRASIHLPRSLRPGTSIDHSFGPRTYKPTPPESPKRLHHAGGSRFHPCYLSSNYPLEIRVIPLRRRKRRGSIWDPNHTN